MTKLNINNFLKVITQRSVLFIPLLLSWNESTHACGKNVKVIVVDVNPSFQREPRHEIEFNPELSSRLNRRLNARLFIHNEPSDELPENTPEINIIIVDDLPIYHKIIKSKFRNQPKVHIFSADNGTEAINIIKFFNSKKIKIHTLFMDYDMGDALTGAETLGLLFDENLLGQHTQIIAHSSELEFNQLLLNAGAQFAVNKGGFDVNYRKIVLSHRITNDSEKQSMILDPLLYDERDIRPW